MRLLLIKKSNFQFSKKLLKIWSSEKSNYFFLLLFLFFSRIGRLCFFLGLPWWGSLSLSRFSLSVSPSFSLSQTHIFTLSFFLSFTFHSLSLSLSPSLSLYFSSSFSLSLSLSHSIFSLSLSLSLSLAFSLSLLHFVLSNKLFRSISKVSIYSDPVKGLSKNTIQRLTES